MKVCCFGERRLEICADCSDYPHCETIGSFHGKKGYIYQRYRRSTDFIRESGYSRFIALADKWNGAYGRLE
jgi:hypothetical protein